MMSRLWDNYKTDYKPLLDFAREKGLGFVATNVPRRYASMVNRGGFEVLDSLSDEAKRFMAPLPIPYDPGLPWYKNMMFMGMGHGVSANLPKAQALKDATMGYFISANLKEGYTFIHYNGEYHSHEKGGILWYLEHYSPGLQLATISAVFQEDTDRLEDENKGIADYIIVVPMDMTRTY